MTYYRRVASQIHLVYSLLYRRLKSSHFKIIAPNRFTQSCLCMQLSQMCPKLDIFLDDIKPLKSSISYFDFSRNLSSCL